MYWRWSCGHALRPPLLPYSRTVPLLFPLRRTFGHWTRALTPAGVLVSCGATTEVAFADRQLQVADSTMGTNSGIVGSAVLVQLAGNAPGQGCRFVDGQRGQSPSQ